ncbi:MAG: V-type ATP synthase subunit E [Synergistaceae bacterium]|jgi:V/A-type H+-transporting ATPase subunit E|nr:V-type ATP synthase subunit E [Synergistaceae bacterium]
MSLAQITEKIEKDANAEAKKILYRAAEQKEEIKHGAETEALALESVSRTRFEKERPEIFKRREIVARLDINKIRLDAQRRLINDVFADALEVLKSLDRDRYTSFFGRLLKEAAASGGEDMEISKGERFINKEWLDKFNGENRTRIEISDKRRDFSGGFVLNNGRVCINCSWEMLMRAAREKLETEVVHRLFPA